MNTANRNLIIGIVVAAFILLLCMCAVVFALVARNMGGVSGIGGLGLVRGSGQIISETRDVSDFAAVRVSGAFEVEIVQGERHRVVITADDNVMPYIQVTRQGDTLVIGNEPGSRVFTNATRHALVEMPTLTAVTLSGATRGNLKGFGPLADVRLEASGASTLQGGLTVEELTLEVSGASTINLTGTGRELTAEASGASRVQMGSFSVARATVDFSGASSGELDVTERLDVELSGASSLTYSGGATVGREDVSGGSSLRQR